MHYYDTLIAIPDIKGKITIKTNKYVMYEIGRTYIKEKGYNSPQRVTIGIKSSKDDNLMYYNENYLKYFDNDDLPVESEVKRSSCLRIGAYIIISKIIKEYELDKLVSGIFNNDGKLILDLATYSIIEESNAALYYHDYAYNHPLFSESMKIYSDSKISSLLKDISDDQRINFLSAWLTLRKKNESVYISYDSTNVNCQALDTELAEYGHAKDDESKPIINMAVGYDLTNSEPLFYEEYPGSIVDVSQLNMTIDKASSFGFKDIGFIIDRGYFSKGNLRYLDELGYNFLIAAKGNKKFINSFIEEVKGKFEDKRINRISKFSCVGTSIVKPLFKGDKQRYIHIYYNELKAAIDRENIESKIDHYISLLNKSLGTKKDYSSYKEYFHLYYDKDEKLSSYAPKNSVIENEKKYCGYFVLVSSKEMKASEALYLYKSRDASEKLFRSDKSFLGGDAYRVYSDQAIKSKTLISFIALIIRNKIYKCLFEEMDSSNNKANYMCVPGAIRELEKIEMIKGGDGIYRLDHAISATQKKILKAFDLDNRKILESSNAIKNQLIKVDKSLK